LNRLFKCLNTQNSCKTKKALVNQQRKSTVCVSCYLACLHDQNKSGFYGGPANQSNLKSLQKPPIGWKKPGPP